MGAVQMKQTYERLTLEDISERIHISRTTIYKVINHKGTVSDATRRTVMEALRKYNYIPNNNARNLAMNRRYPIACIGFNSPDAIYFAPTIEEGIRQAVQNYGDHGLIVDSYFSSAEQPKQQIEDIQSAYNSGIRHFIIACADTDQLKPSLAELKSSGCTVILLSKYAGPEFCDAFIGMDDCKSGQLAAEMLGHMIPSDGSLQVLMARESHSNTTSTQQRLEGFLSYLKQYHPSIQILPFLQDLENSSMIEKSLTDILTGRKPDGIFDLTCRLHIISRILHQKNMADVAFVGMDLYPEIIPFIRDHTIDAVIFQNLKAQTYLACRLLFDQMCYGNEIPQKVYHSKLEIVMSGNLEYFLEL